MEIPVYINVSNASSNDEITIARPSYVNYNPANNCIGNEHDNDKGRHIYANVKTCEADDKNEEKRVPVYVNMRPSISCK